MEMKFSDISVEQITNYLQYEKPSMIIAGMFISGHGGGYYFGVVKKINFFNIYDKRVIDLFNSICGTDIPLEVSINCEEVWKEVNPDNYPNPNRVRDRIRYQQELSYLLEQKERNPILSVPYRYHFNLREACEGYLEQAVKLCETFKKNRRRFLGNFQTDSSDPFEVSRDLYALLGESQKDFITLLDLYSAGTPEYETACKRLSLKSKKIGIYVTEVGLLGNLRNSLDTLNWFYHGNLSYLPQWFRNVFFKDCRDYKNREVYACYNWARKNDPKVPINIKEPLQNQIARTQAKIKDLLGFWKETNMDVNEEIQRDREAFYRELVSFFTISR